MQIKRSLGILATALTVSALAAGAYDFARGYATTWQSDNLTSIRYTISSNVGSGSPDLHCDIRTPSGYVVPMNGGASAWHDGQSESTFNYAPSGGGERGRYTATCYWHIENSGGLNGNHAVTSVSFYR